MVVPLSTVVKEIMGQGVMGAICLSFAEEKDFCGSSCSIAMWDWNDGTVFIEIEDSIDAFFGFVACRV